MISPHTLFNLPYLQGKGIIDALPFLPDPTKSKHQREQYVRYVVPFAAWSACTAACSFYGFNVWLLPISLELYGADALYSMRNGMVLYAFTCSGFVANIIQLYTAPYVTEWSSGVVMLVGVICNVLGLVLSGVSVQHGSEAGLFACQLLLAGTSLALLGYFTQIKTLLWFREIGRPVYGAATVGFGVGFWATTFSFWCPALVDGVSIPESFYYTAFVVLIFSLPSVFLLRSPDELPLESNVNISLDDLEENVVHVPNTKEGQCSNDEEEQIDTSNVNIVARISDPETSEKTPDNEESQNHKDGIIETVSPALSKIDFEKKLQNHLQFLVWLLTFTVGFAPKYTISPIFSAVFDASQSLQSTVSFLFLASYTIARICVAFAIGPRFTIDLVIRLATGIAPLCFFFMGAVVYEGKTDTLWMWLFTVANMVVAFCLGSQKLCIQPISLKNWGVNNVKQVVARVLLALRLASFVGPVLVWRALSGTGNIFLDPSLNTSKQQRIDLERSMSATLLAIGGVGVMACLGQSFFMRPYNGKQ